MKKRFIALCLVVVMLLCVLTGCGQIQNARPITDVHNLDGQRVGVALAWGPDYLLTERDDLTLVRYNHVAFVSFPGLDVDPLQHPAIDTLNLQLLTGFTRSIRSARNGDGAWEVQIGL